MINSDLEFDSSSPKKPSKSLAKPWQPSQSCLNFTEGLFRGGFLLIFLYLLLKTNLYIFDQADFFHVNYKDYNCYISSRNLYPKQDWFSLFRSVNLVGMEKVIKDRYKRKEMEMQIKDGKCEMPENYDPPGILLGQDNNIHENNIGMLGKIATGVKHWKKSLSSKGLEGSDMESVEIDGNTAEQDLMESYA